MGTLHITNFYQKLSHNVKTLYYIAVLRAISFSENRM